MVSKLRGFNTSFFNRIKSLTLILHLLIGITILEISMVNTSNKTTFKTAKAPTKNSSNFFSPVSITQYYSLKNIAILG